MHGQLATLVCLVCTAFAQLVSIGPPDPDYCYKVEALRPNLELRREVRLVGTVFDQAGGIIENSRVELRRFVSDRKQTPLKVVTTDAQGHFDLGIVKAGKYRLLPFPTRAFYQPDAIMCPSGKTCDLKIVLRVHPTDLPDSPCPIR